MPGVIESFLIKSINDYLVSNPLLTYTQISKKIGVSRPTVAAHAKKLGFKPKVVGKVRTHFFNESYFEKIDTFNKAYVLGLLYADGCNTRVGMALALQEEDLEIIQFVKKELCYTGSLKYVLASNPNWKNKWEIRIKSNTLSKQLDRLGCKPNKSLSISFPTFLSENLLPHFIRGYFDGDGCISKGKKGEWHLSFTSGSPEFLIPLKKYLEDRLGIYFQHYPKYYSISTSRKDTICNIIRYMYTDSTFSMLRKKEKCMRFLVEKGDCYSVSIA